MWLSHSCHMLRRFVDSHATALAPCVALLAGVVALAVIYARAYPLDDPIRGDVVGYYIYLPATFLDRDVSLERTIDRSFDGNPENTYSDLRRVDGGYLGPHQIGEAIMLAPFFAVGDLVARARDERRDGFSWPYQAAVAAGGLLYGVLGLTLLGSFLRRWFERAVVVATLLVLTFGTNLFHYLTYDAGYSHAFSFAVVAFVLWQTMRLADRPNAARAFALGLAVGLAGAIRPTNLLIVLFPLLVNIGSRSEAKHRVTTLAARPHLLVAFACGALIPLAMQLLYWHHLTGDFIFNAYDADPRLELAHPHLIDVAFSVRKGLLFWTPLVGLGVAGLFVLRGRARGLLLPTAVFLAASFWFMASWSEWWYGGSFGQRAFVESLPPLAIGIAALFAWARAGRALVPVGIAALVTTGLALHAMLAYWRGDIPFDGTTWGIYLDSFGWL
jgi:hypothetical protein